MAHFIPVPEERQCTANAYMTGRRCSNAAIKGGTVCHAHGGKAKHVREAANRRLMELMPDAVRALYELVNDQQSRHVRMQAAKDILDRLGLAPAQKIEAEIKNVSDEEWQTTLQEYATAYLQGVEDTRQDVNAKSG